MAKTVIGTLVVAVAANTRPLTKGLGNAQGAVGKFAAGASMAGAAVTAVAAGAVIAAGAVALATRKFTQFGDDVAKMARRTGLSTEAVSELGHAAQIGGADMDSLEKGVKRMARTITDAQSGLMTYQRAFQRIGMNAEELRGASPEQAFMRIGKAIADTEDPILRAAAAQEIFGRAGTRLLPMFQAGEKGMAALRKEARELGISMSSDTARKAEEVRDAFTRLFGSIKGIAITIGAAVAPYVVKFADLLTKAFVWVRKTVFPIIGQFVNTVLRAFLTMRYAVAHWKDFLSLGLTIALHAIVKFANQVRHFFTGVIPDVLKWFGKNWKAIFRDIWEFSKTTFMNLGKNVGNLAKNIKNLLLGKVTMAELWTPLTEGFEKTLSTLPEIADRQIGKFEGQLAARIDELAHKLGPGMMADVERRMGDLKDFFKLPEMAAQGFEHMGDAAVQAEKKVTSLTRPAAVEAGTAGAVSLALGGHYAGLQTQMSKLAQTGKRTADASERTADAVEAMEMEDDEVRDI